MNRKGEEMPDTLIAVVTAVMGEKKNKQSLKNKDHIIKNTCIPETPGIGTMGRFASLHAETNCAPGSEMRGVPASVVNATCFPSFT